MPRDRAYNKDADINVCCTDLNNNNNRSLNAFYWLLLVLLALSFTECLKGVMIDVTHRDL